MNKPKLPWKNTKERLENPHGRPCREKPSGLGDGVGEGMGVATAAKNRAT